jgi:hypothetical protein
MKTPKEKAKELFEKFLFYTLNDFSDENFEQTRQCALVAVDEIIQILPTSEYLEDVGNTIENRQRTYWNQVKQEIKNL